MTYLPDKFPTKQLQVKLLLVKATLTLTHVPAHWKVAVHVNFTNKKILNTNRLTTNGNFIHDRNSAIYLRLHTEAKIKWIEHIDAKITELNIRYTILYFNLEPQIKNLNIQQTADLQPYPETNL